MELTIHISEKDVLELIKHNPYYAHYKQFDPARYTLELQELENLKVDIDIQRGKNLKRVVRVDKELTGFQKSLLAVKLSKEVMNNESFILQDKTSTLKVPKLGKVPELKKILPALPPEAKDFFQQIDVLDDFKKVETMREVYITQAEKYGVEAKYLKELFKEANISAFHKKVGTKKLEKAYEEYAKKMIEEGRSVAREDILKDTKKLEEVFEGYKGKLEGIKIGEEAQIPSGKGRILQALKSRWYYFPIVGGVLYLIYSLLTGEDDNQLKKLALPEELPQGEPIPPNLYKIYADAYARLAGLAEREYFNTIREAQRQIFLAQMYHQYAMNKYLQAYNPDIYTVNRILLYADMQYNLPYSERQKLIEKLLKGSIIAKARGIEVANVAEYLKYSDIEMPDLDRSIREYTKTVSEFLSYNLKPIEKRLNLYQNLSSAFMKKAVDFAVKYQYPVVLENQANKLKEEYQKRIAELSREVEELKRQREALEKSSIPATSDDKTLFAIIKKFFKLGKEEKKEEERKEIEIEEEKKRGRK